MNIVKSFSRRTFFWLFFLILMFAASMAVSIYMGMQYMFTLLPPDHLRAAILDVPELRAGMEEAQYILELAYLLFLPVCFGLLFLLFLILWIAVRGILIRVLRREGFTDLAKGKKESSGKTAAKEKPKKGKKGVSGKTAFKPMEDEEAPPVSMREIEDSQRRYYLHFLSVLQREGRLMDFLTEDLGPYDDTQIGAAVRSIHENCKKSMEKHLSPTFIMSENEGDQVTVPVDFDSSTLKLTGNVTGEPPFSGILRHRGWRAGKLELPMLTGVGDPKIIAPAEIEIP